jgi:hypothetical protein
MGSKIDVAHRSPVEQQQKRLLLQIDWHDPSNYQGTANANAAPVEYNRLAQQLVQQLLHQPPPPNVNDTLRAIPLVPAFSTGLPLHHGDIAGATRSTS